MSYMQIRSFSSLRTRVNVETTKLGNRRWLFGFNGLDTGERHEVGNYTGIEIDRARKSREETHQPNNHLLNDRCGEIIPKHIRPLAPLFREGKHRKSAHHYLKT